METLGPLSRYRRYLVGLDREAADALDDESLDLLSQPEVVDLLCLRDEIESMPLSESERAELQSLDRLLVKHGRLVALHMPSAPERRPVAWWWRLDEDPRLRGRPRAS
jgi:hypothetical protein